MKLAQRLNRIEEPQTIRMAKLSRELKAEGKSIIDLSIGEPDFKTPQHIIDAANTAMQDGFTKYTPVAGFPELRQAIVEKFKRENNLDFSIDEILVSTGAKQSLANAILSIVDPGDEVLIPTPYWVTYVDLVKLSEGKVNFVETTHANNFKITPEDLEKNLTPKTTLFIFSSPSNPTGSIYTKEELKALADVFVKHPQVFIISDEIYEHIHFDQKPESIAQFEELKNQVLVVNGMSKGFAMTGWRLGYIAGPKEVIKACEKMQSQFTSGANSITQRASIVALNSNLDATYAMRDAYKERRNFVISTLKNIKGIEINNPDGAFYAFPYIKHFIGKNNINNSEELCMYLLHEVGVSCVDGSAFGSPNYIRLSYATSMENLEIAMQRLQLAFEKIY